MTGSGKNQTKALMQGRGTSKYNLPLEGNEAASEKCVIYVRVLPKTSEESNQLNETQLAYCKQHAEERNYFITGVFEDPAISDKVENRTGLFNAIEALPRGGVLLVYKLKHLSQNVYLEEVIKNEIELRGFRIEAVKNVIQEQKHEQDHVRQTLVNIEEYNRKFTALRTRSAMADKQALGKRVGRYAPYGWRLDESAEGGMVPEPKEQIVVDAAIKMYEGGLPTFEIVKALNRDYRELARAKGGFQQKTVQKIIDRVSFAEERIFPNKVRAGVLMAKKRRVMD